MTTILAQRLDSKIERGATRRVMHPSRTKVYSADGQLKQNFPSSRLKHIFDVSHGVRSQADYMEVLSAFYAVMGTPRSGLLFKDWADYQGTILNTGVVLITGSTWQLERLYTFGSVTYRRKITRPRTGVVVYDAGGSPLTASVDTATGIATVTGTPAKWAGEFDVPVTFAMNEWSAQLEVHTTNLHLVNESIELEEVFE
jgi:uncharacterized protein (TIGR02217 family)